MRIDVWQAPSCLDAVAIAPGFGAILPSHRLADTMRRNVADGGRVYVALDGATLVGYATVVPVAALSTAALDRWHDLPDALELGAIEVARSARRRGLATAMLARLSQSTDLERFLVLAHGMASHWDLRGSNLSLGRYREMLIRLLGRAAFVVRDTDDPDVADDPFHFLAVRVGSRVPPASLEAFRRRLFLEGACSSAAAAIAATSPSR